MISVIICSVNPQLLNNVTASIKATIGVPYEIIAIDNRNSREGICKVYNEAAENAKYNILCFVHEDVLFHTNGWGEELNILLSDPNIGLVGISGAIYKSSYPATWSACDKSLYRTNSIQHFKDQNMPVRSYYIKDQESKYSETVLVDGVFMTTRKNVWSRYHFDQVNFNDFHGYDLDFSFAIRAKYKVVVSHKILIEHLSEGTLSKEWINSSIMLHKKWSDKLPVWTEKPEKSILKQSNYIAASSFLSILLKFKGYHFLVILFYFTVYFKYFNFNRLKYTKSFFLYFTKI